MKISLIIPFYNTKHKYLCQLFNSIDNSNSNNLEFIFIDDGSDDATSKLVQSFCKKHSFLFFKFQKNLGVSNARNKGIELSSNNHIMFLDSDDLLNFDFLNNNDWDPTVDLIMFTDSIFFNKPPECFMQTPIAMDLDVRDISVLYFRNSDHLNLRSSCCKILNKKIINKCNLRFDTVLPFYEDAFFMSEYYKHISTFDAYSNSIYYYRIYNSSSSKRHNRDYISKYQLFFDKYIAAFSDNINFINALYKDTFFSVLPNKFIRSIKNFHFCYAFKILKTDFIFKSSIYIHSCHNAGSFEHRFCSKILEKKYLAAFFKYFLHRLCLSWATRSKRNSE